MAWIIGVDEVGRGSLAGPLVTCGVLVERPARNEWPVKGVRDSKKLTPEKREILAAQLTGSGKVFFHTHSTLAHTVDSKGLSAALGESFRTNITHLLKVAAERNLRVDAVLVDGEALWTPQALTGTDGPPLAYITKGDDKEWAIGAASIIAKVSRDAYMKMVHLIHPQYGWDSNMGYGTAAHEAAIRHHGLSPQHRRSFCRKFIGKDDDVLEMFGS